MMSRGGREKTQQFFEEFEFQRETQDRERLESETE